MLKVTAETKSNRTYQLVVYADINMLGHNINSIKGNSP
jgi:hypothetical protein